MALACVLSGCLFGGKGGGGGGGGEVTIEYAPIAIAWVKKHVPATPNDVKTWAATPEGRSAAGTEIRHVLVVIAEPKAPRDVAAAKKRAQVLIGRLTKGEDPKALAREASDDDDTRDKGGALGTDEGKLPEPLRTVAKQLGPGDLAGDPIKGPRGFHIVLRDAQDDAQIMKAYKKARATTVARKLADELLARLQSADASVPIETVFKESVAAVLGEAAANDPKRHKADAVPRDGAASADLPPDARDSGPIKRAEDDRNAITNARFLFEVTSPSTEEYDRGDKLSQYKQLASLEAVYLISHRQREITVVRPEPSGFTERVFRGGEQAPLLGASVDVEALYSVLQDLG